MSLLDIRNLTIELDTPQGRIVAVEKMNLVLQEGEVRGVVGESGSGKTLLARAIMGLLPPNWHVKADRMFFDNTDLQQMTLEERRLFMGKSVALIFQQPSSYLDPSSIIKDQLFEALPAAIGRSLPFWKRGKFRQQKIISILHKAGIKDHQRVLDAYPNELSEGVCQKIMIAIALINQPRLLIADEPTSKMDSFNKLQVHKLLEKINQLDNVSILHISNDLETSANWTERLTIMYCGQAVEFGPTKAVVNTPIHPYTQALVASIPNKHEQELLPILPGTVPSFQHLPIGCRLGPRCPYAQKGCIKPPAMTLIRNRSYRCHFPLNLKSAHGNKTA